MTTRGPRAVIAAFALAACSADAGGSAAGGSVTTAAGGSTTTGMGGSATTSTTSQTTMGTGGGTDGGTGDPCSAGLACAQCPDYPSCLACNSVAHQAGVSVYNALLACIFCDACYTTCQGAVAFPMLCSSAPAMKNPCDGAMADATACNGGATSCQTCAQKGSCQAALSTCMGNTDCDALLSAVPLCPAM